MKTGLLAAVTLTLGTAFTATQAAPPYSTWMADSLMAKTFTKPLLYDYTLAVLYRAYDMVYQATGTTKYRDAVNTKLNAMISSTGTITGYPQSSTINNLDDILMGRVILDHYAQDTTKTKFKTAATKMRNQLSRQKRTASGGFWHKDPKYPNQMWLDGIYMGDVFYAQYTAMFAATNTTAWNDILLQYTLIEQHVRDATSKLLYHGYDESKVAVWSKTSPTGSAPMVWNRGLGWYMMALVDVLEYFPTSHPGYNQLLTYFQTLADAVVATQDPNTKGWWMIMNPGYEGRSGNYIESSGTAMFAYSLLKGARLGYLPNDPKYVTAGKSGFTMMTTTFVLANAPGGLLNWEGTLGTASLNSDGTYAYYTSCPVVENELKGAGPFIYAAVEYEKLPPQ